MNKTILIFLLLVGCTKVETTSGIQTISCTKVRAYAGFKDETTSQTVIFPGSIKCDDGSTYTNLYADTFINHHECSVLKNAGKFVGTIGDCNIVDVKP